jgi:CRISPR system Cascade subunit CasA
VNLLEERWIPVRRESGATALIAPHEMTDGLGSDPIIALDAPRPDFNGALIQFLIGLVQTAWVVADENWDRDEALWSPPTPKKLQELFSPLKRAFELEGEGPRFMQDLSLGPADKPTENSISALLIDYPSANAIDGNRDHFVKRGSDPALCLQCAAAALFTLMTNAPEGGQGHRTSIRGGGPLTTLIKYTRNEVAQPAAALWRDVACNVLEVAVFRREKAGPRDLAEIFPWLRSIDQTMGDRGTVQPLDVDPLQVYWATPRRITLDISVSDAETAPKSCATCGRPTQRRVERYNTKNYGLNYEGPWRHPLSPYYRSRPLDPLRSMHPRPDGLTYRHWLGWTLGASRGDWEVLPAQCVHAFHSTRVSAGQVRMWAFGYDLDKGKPRCWYEGTYPLFDLIVSPPESPELAEVVAGVVALLVGAAEEVAKHVRDAVWRAWLGDGKGKGDLEFVKAEFWDRTEGEFYAKVERILAMGRQFGRETHDRSEPIRREWLDSLRRTGRRLFDDIAARGSVESGNPIRLAAAHRELTGHLSGRKLQATLGLVSFEPAGSERMRRPGSNVSP